LPPDEVGQVTRHARPYVVAAGVDWGVSRDANALCLVAPLDDKGLNDPKDGLRYFVPWLDYAYRCPYGEWIERICAAGRAYGLHVVASEINGVGAYPTEQLRERLAVVGAVYGVAGVWTDNRRKQAGFGKLKVMLQRGQLVLPRVPELLKQLRNLEFEQMPGGSLRIEVPARAGHDDLVLALMQAISCVRPMPGQVGRRVADVDHRDGAGGAGSGGRLAAGLALRLLHLACRVAGRQHRMVSRPKRTQPIRNVRRRRRSWRFPWTSSSARPTSTPCR
jgi:hypothetical protein